jgi:hypothetical protein
MEVSKIQMEKKELVLFSGKKILKKLYEKKVPSECDIRHSAMQSQIRLHSSVLNLG